MSGHRIPFDLFNAQNKKIKDPGNAGTITPTRDLGHVALVSAAAETRTLAAPIEEGLHLLLYMKTDGGNITLTVTGGFDEAGTTTATFSETGQFLHLVSVEEGSNIRWRVAGYDGVTGPALSLFVKQGAPATATDTATLSAANLKTGIVVGTPTAAATYTLPTGTLFEAQFPSFATDDAFDFSIINVATNALFIITVAAGTGWTLSGSARVDANAGTAQSQGRFRARRTAANTFTLYRIS